MEKKQKFEVMTDTNKKEKTLRDILWEAGLFDEPVADNIFKAVAIEKENSHKAVLESVREMVEGLQKTYEGATMYFGVSKRIRVDGYNQALQDILKEIDQTLSELEK